MGSSYMYDKLDAIWSKIEADGDKECLTKGRKYNRIDIENETGFRLSCCFPDHTLELLIELNHQNNLNKIIFPKWKGMGFEVIQLPVPKKETFHISLKLENREYRDVFTSLCADLANDLIDIDIEKREKALVAFLDRWTRFFERYGQKGLSPEKQRGLFGELFWFNKLIEKEFDYVAILNGWKGCEKGYHDFEIMGHVVEVKTTMTKEPRKVRISNERQLDDRGLISLHLFILTLIKAEKGGTSLPDLVELIMSFLSSVPSGQRKFEDKLKEAGYLDIHAHLYRDTYSVKKEELFKIGDEFPRIIEIPDGLGDINYSLVVAAADKFRLEIDEYLEQIKRVI